MNGMTKNVGHENGVNRRTWNYRLRTRTRPIVCNR